MVNYFRNRKDFERRFESYLKTSISTKLDDYFGQNFENLEDILQPLGLVLGSSYLLATICEITGYDIKVVWVPALIGGVVGSWFAILNRFGLVRLWIPPKRQLKVVITGGTKGIGKAMAREFLLSGDKVIITSRSLRGVQAAVHSLRTELDLTNEIIGIDCDITSSEKLSQLTKYAKQNFGSIDVWINNAGYSGGFQTVLDMEDSTVETVVQTNLTGTILSTKAAINFMRKQKSQGHIFNMDGAGADGSATPMYSVYGSTKAGISFMSKTLEQELRTSQLLGSRPKVGVGSSNTEATQGWGQGQRQGQGQEVGIHTLSPGMVLTDLLLEGATIANKQVFNFLCEQPETVAAYLVPRVRSVVARNVSGSYIKFLTPVNVLWRFLTAASRVGRFFDADGNPTFQDENERLIGRKAKATARLAQKFRTRDANLGVVYSLSVAVSYMIIISYSMSDKFM